MSICLDISAVGGGGCQVRDGIVSISYTTYCNQQSTSDNSVHMCPLQLTHILVLLMLPKHTDSFPLQNSYVMSPIKGDIVVNKRNRKQRKRYERGTVNKNKVGICD